VLIRYHEIVNTLQKNQQGRNYQQQGGGVKQKIEKNETISFLMMQEQKFTSNVFSYTKVQAK
jgi:hypothetical protein